MWRIAHPAERNDHDETAYDLVNEWYHDSVPLSIVVEIIDGRADLRDVDIGWDEFFDFGLADIDPSSFSGFAWDYRNVMEGYPDAQESITDERVADHISEWQSDFLATVLRAMQVITRDDDESGPH